MFGLEMNSTPRYVPDAPAAFDGPALNTRGLLSGGYVGTAMGWRPVNAITAGDMVLTFDNGVRPVVEVRHETFLVSDMMALSAFDCVMVPAGTLGNVRDFLLLPDQGVMIESDAACDAQGDPFAVVPARSLAGYRGITRVKPRTQIEVITLVFEQAQVVYAEGGALIHCPPAQVCLSDVGQQNDAYQVVPEDEAKFLVECMIVEKQASVAA